MQEPDPLEAFSVVREVIRIFGGEASSSQWSDVRSVLKVRGNHLDSDYLTEMAESMGLRDLLDRAIGEARE